jgi:hypothetical protein
MTRGNQRDNDRAKALKKAGNTVRLITPVLFVHTDHFYRRARTPCPVANSLGARKTPLPSCARSRGRVCIPQGARRKSNLHYETGLLITSLYSRRKESRRGCSRKKQKIIHLNPSIQPVSQSHLPPPLSRPPEADNPPSNVAKCTTSEGRRWIYGYDRNLPPISNYQNLGLGV